MKIETQFNIGDEAWFMYKLEPISAKVTYITIYAQGKNVIEYFFEKPFVFVREEYVFKTKKELLNSYDNRKKIDIEKINNIYKKNNSMKKYLVLAVFATTLVACEKSELKSAEETIFEFREEKKQDANFKLFNSHIIGVKDDYPQGSQNNNSKDEQGKQKQEGSKNQQ